MNPGKVIGSLCGIVGALWLFWAGIAYVVFLPAGWPNYRLGGKVIGLTLHAPYAGAIQGERQKLQAVLAADARAAAQDKAASAREVADANAITAHVRADLTAQLARAQANTRTLIKEVPTYVTAHADAGCVVTRGFVLEHDAAARGDALAAVPSPSGGDVDAPSGLGLSAVASTVVGNYGICHAAMSEAQAWRTWYAEQRDKYEAARALAAGEAK